MVNESIRKVTEAREALRNQLESLQTTTKMLEQNEAMQRLSELAEHHHEIMYASLGSPERLWQASLLDPTSDISATAQRMTDLMVGIENRFCLPAIHETSELLGKLERSNIAKALERYQQQVSELERVIESMKMPWLDMHDPLRSIGAFADLQGIGHALSIAPAFEEGLTEALRLSLGDWQERIEWPANIFTDPLARTTFYEEHGLDRALAAFPANAFHESLFYAGLYTPPIVEEFSTEPNSKPDTDEDAFVRTNNAHYRLTRFEDQVRKFIDERMCAAFGEHWIKHQVPGQIYKAWREKREKALENGEQEWPLIAYADFSDYVPIITRRDNWNAVFKPIFRRQTFVQESFQRLYPIRICTMHSRTITQDDELYLYVETKRILSAIGVVI